VTSASEELEKIQKLGRRVAETVSLAGLEVVQFAISPSLNGDNHVARVVLKYDPANELKPDIQVLQIEGQVDQAAEDALRERNQKQADDAREGLKEILSDEHLRGRGGFLD